MHSPLAVRSVSESLAVIKFPSSLIPSCWSGNETSFLSALCGFMAIVVYSRI